LVWHKLNAPNAPNAGNKPEADAEQGQGTDECPPGMFPDDVICVHLPNDEDGAQEGEVVGNIHRLRTGRWASYDQIPRRPDRPADYDAYLYPIPPGIPGGKSVISGYDLDKPNEQQRRGPTLRATGHGGVDLPQAKGTPIRMLPLEHQRGDADVIYVGPLFGTTVVTRHMVLEGNQLRPYLLLFGHLDAPAFGLSPGAHLEEGALVGYVGDTGSPELVHLHLEARRVQEGVEVTPDFASKVGPSGLLSNDTSIVCDPRNVLPLK
jgi:murein DD-endopeptidase MepM/ murein hydrolase activator NlpD